MTAQKTIANPEFMRLPGRGYDPIFGLSRAWYYTQIGRGTIKSANIRRPGCHTGVRLIQVESVRELIGRNMEG